MNLHDKAVRLRHIMSDILDLSEAMSGVEGEINHADAMDVTAVVVKGVISALASDNKKLGIEGYRDEFVERLDHLVLKFEVKA